LVAWSHAFHKWDYLVTRDKNFHAHKDELKRVGIKEVVYPKDAVRICSFWGVNIEKIRQGLSKALFACRRLLRCTNRV